VVFYLFAGHVFLRSLFFVLTVSPPALLQDVGYVNSSHDDRPPNIPSPQENDPIVGVGSGFSVRDQIIMEEIPDFITGDVLSGQENDSPSRKPVTGKIRYIVTVPGVR
jgi:hypothetical protein